MEQGHGVEVVAWLKEISCSLSAIAADTEEFKILFSKLIKAIHDLAETQVPTLAPKQYQEERQHGEP